MTILYIEREAVHSPLAMMNANHWHASYLEAKKPNSIISTIRMATKFRALIVTVQLRLKEIIYTVAIFRLQRYTQKGKRTTIVDFIL